MINFSSFWYDVYSYKLDTKYTYYELKRGFKYANGCGAKGGIKFPDTMWFVNIVSACIIHDIEWQLAKNYEELLIANERFDNNLKRITDKKSLYRFTRWLRRYRIASYINGVELEGTNNYAKEREFEIPEHMQEFVFRNSSNSHLFSSFFKD